MQDHRVIAGALGASDLAFPLELICEVIDKAGRVRSAAACCLAAAVMIFVLGLALFSADSLR